MKKPKYTRQTNYYVPKTHIVDKTTICEFEESIARNTVARERLIKTPGGNKPLLSKKDAKFILRIKKHINKNLKGTKKILKSILRKSQNKSFDIFEYASPRCSLETIALVQKSPEITEYLKKAYTDIQSSPLKDCFCWYLTTVLNDSGLADSLFLSPLENKHRGKNKFKIANRAHAYTKTLCRLYVRYASTRSQARAVCEQEFAKRVEPC
jgi:hypothetical protein